MGNNQKKIGVLLSYTNLIINTLIPFFYTPIMLKILGQAEYGLYGLSTSITSYLSLLNLGLSSTIVRYVLKYKSENNKNMINNLIGLFSIIYSIIGIIILVIGLFLSLNCNALFANGLNNSEIEKLKILIFIMALNMPISMIGSIYSSILLAYEKFTFKYLMDIISTIVSPIFNLIALYLGFGSIGMALVSTIIIMVIMPINIINCRNNLGIHIDVTKLPLFLVKEIFSFSSVVFMSSIADLLFWATDKVLIGSYLGAIYVAIYNVGGTFTHIFQNMAHSISGVFSPTANALVFEGKPIEESSALLIKVGRLQYLIVSLVISGFIVFGKKFLLYWAGPDYELSYYIALYTMIPLTIPLIQNVAYNTIMAMNKHLFRSKMYFLISVLNAFTTFLVIPKYGVIGAAFCTGISYLVGHGIILNLYYYKSIKLDIPLFWKNIIFMSFIPFLMIVAGLYIFPSFIVITNFKSLIICIVIYTIIYCLFSWLFTMNNYEKELIKKIIRRV